MMTTMQERMTKALATMDPETLMKMWLPGGGQSFEQMQKAFWERFASGGRKGTDP